MNKINAVIVDNNYSYIRNLEKYFSTREAINVVATFKTGDEALNYLVNNSKEYDWIIMDLLLPKVDGTTILDELFNNGIKKKVIITSSYIDDMLMRDAKLYNIVNYFKKPYQVEAIERTIIKRSHISSLVINGTTNIELVITNVLHDLGIPSHLKGFKYLKEAIILIYTDPTITYVTKDLYPRIAETFQTRDVCVERSIRHAIEVGIIRGNYDYQTELFRYSVNTEKNKPTNYEFISTIVERIKIENNYM